MAQAAIAAIKVAASYVASKLTAGVVAKIGLQLAASAVLAKLTTPSPSRNQGLLVQTSLSAEHPRMVQVGKRLSGGVFVDWLTKGSINEDTWRIFYLGEGPMGDVTGIYADGALVHSGTLSHGQTVTLSALDNRVQVTYYDGRPGQTAHSSLVSEAVGWTNNHVGRGMAYCIVYARFHDTKLVVPPDFSFEVEGAKLYDRRQDSTAGGSGSQRLKDPSTWQLSTNPAVALDHYLLGRYLSNSDDEAWFGVGLDPSIVPYDAFADLANLCDEQVNLKVTGTQDRYAMNGFIFADEVFRDVIRRICDHMNARPADFGGLISVIDGESKVSVLTLDKADAIDESAEVYKPKAPYVQIVGGVEGRYQDPANNYQPTDYPRYTEADWKVQDGGEVKYVTRDFDYEVNQERAERLASLFAKRSRRQATLSGIYSLAALVLEEGDWYTRTGGKFGSGKVFEVVGSPVLDVETMTVAVQGIEVDPDDSAWDETTATDQAAAPDADPSAPVLAVPTLEVTAVDVNSGGVQIPGVRFKHNNYTMDPPISIEIEVAENDGSNGPEGDRQTMFMVHEQQFGILTGLLPSTGYVTRWRGRIGELQSAWSSWATFTTTAGYTVGSAASVPWSGVQNDGGRPDDNADRTVENTALAIVGQGPWATFADSVESVTDRFDRGLDGILENGDFEIPWSGNAVPPGWTSWDNGLLTHTDYPVGPGKSGYAVGAAGSNHGILQYRPVKGGKSYVLEAEIRRGGGTTEGAGVQVRWYNAAGNVILKTDSLPFSTSEDTSGDVPGTHPDGATKFSRLYEAPADAANVMVYAMTHFGNFGDISAENQIYWRRCDLRLATLTDKTAHEQVLANYADASRVAIDFSNRLYWADVVSSNTGVDVPLPQAQIADTAHGKAWQNLSGAHDYVVARRPINVDPGSSIEFRLRHFKTGSDSERARLYMYKFNSAGAYVGFIYAGYEYITDADGVVTTKLNVNIPSDTHSVWPYIYIDVADHHLLSLEWIKEGRFEADVTGESIAAGFVGQGGLATRNDVDTEQILSGAVTNSQNGDVDGSITLSNNTWTDVASFLFTSVGIGVRLTASLDIDMFMSAGSVPIAQIRLVRDSTVLKTSQPYVGNDAGSGFVRLSANASIAKSDLPAAGSYTYKLQALLIEGSGASLVTSFEVLNRAFEGVERKR